MPSPPPDCPPRHVIKLGNVEVEVLPSRRVNLPRHAYLAGSVLEMNRAIEMTVAFFAGSRLPKPSKWRP
jgi:N-acetylglucosamine-6-phosphate deacetylase